MAVGYMWIKTLKTLRLTHATLNPQVSEDRVDSKMGEHVLNYKTENINKCDVTVEGKLRNALMVFNLINAAGILGIKSPTN